MIVEIIAKYLESNKRLVVPNLGAFIVKIPAQAILFSNLIKGDDGVLRSLLMQEGVSELDSAALIDRFVFEVNHRLEQGGVCALEGFGVLKSGNNGTVGFVLDYSAKGDVLDGDADQKLAQQQAAASAASSLEVNEKTSSEPIAEIKSEPTPEPQVKAEAASESDEEVIIDVVPRVESATAERKPRQESREEVRRQRAQDNYVKGLRYGKGRKVVTGREGVTSRKSSVGTVIIFIAIIAALAAIAALAYGMWNDWQQHNYMYEGLYDEPSSESMPSSAEQGVRNPDLDYITPNE